MNKPANSFEAVKLVLDHAPKDLTLAQRLVLIQIARHYPTPHLSQKTLAAEIGIRRIDTVYKAIKVLVNRELLIVERQGQMKANKYSLNTHFIDTAQTAILTTRQTGILTTRQTVNHDTRQTAIKQRSIKEYKKEAFSDFLNNFPDSIVSEFVVLKAWKRALLKVASEDLLVTASRTNRDKLQPDAWLNFEKWNDVRSDVVEDDSWKERAVND
jgi:DNA-binding MarR family transcriptional regulator